MDHAALPELIAGRALDDLDVEERRVVESHLPSCAACRALERDLGSVLSGLALAAPARPVPAFLGATIMTSIHLDRPARGGGPSTALRGRDRAGMSLALAAAGLVIVALGIGLIQTRQQLGDARLLAGSALERLGSGDTAIALVADPAHASAWLQPSADGITGAALMIYLPGSTRAYLVARGLPATPAGQVYQFWHADGAGVHPGPTFAYDGTAVAVIPVGVDLGGAAAAMLTLEPATGAASTPGKDVVFGELPAS